MFLGIKQDLKKSLVLSNLLNKINAFKVPVLLWVEDPTCKFWMCFPRSDWMWLCVVVRSLLLDLSE